MKDAFMIERLTKQISSLSKRYMLIQINARSAHSSQDCAVYSISYHDDLKEVKQMEDRFNNFMTQAHVIDQHTGFYEDHWFKDRGWIGNFHNNLIAKGILPPEE